MIPKIRFWLILVAFLGVCMAYAVEEGKTPAPNSAQENGIYAPFVPPSTPAVATPVDPTVAAPADSSAAAPVVLAAAATPVVQAASPAPAHKGAAHKSAASKSPAPKSPAPKSPKPDNHPGPYSDGIPYGPTPPTKSTRPYVDRVIAHQYWKFLLRKASNSLEQAEKKLEEYGSVTMSDPMLAPAGSNFQFGLALKPTQLFTDAQANVEGSAASRLLIQQILSAGGSAQFNLPIPTPPVSTPVPATTTTTTAASPTTSAASTTTTSPAPTPVPLVIMNNNNNAGAPSTSSASPASATPSPSSASNAPAASSANSAQMSASDVAIPPSALNTALQGQESSFTTILPQPQKNQVTGVPDRVAMIAASGDAATQSLLNFLGDPTTIAKFKDKVIFVGVVTVAVDPGWRTKKDFAAQISVRSTYEYQPARASILRKIIAATPASKSKATPTPTPASSPDDDTAVIVARQTVNLDEEAVDDAQEAVDDDTNEASNPVQKAQKVVDGDNALIAKDKDNPAQLKKDQAKLAKDKLAFSAAQTKVSGDQQKLADAKQKLRDDKAKLRSVSKVAEVDEATIKAAHDAEVLAEKSRAAYEIKAARARRAREAAAASEAKLTAALKDEDAANALVEKTHAALGRSWFPDTSTREKATEAEALSKKVGGVVKEARKRAEEDADARKTAEEAAEEAQLTAENTAIDARANAQTVNDATTKATTAKAAVAARSGASAGQPKSTSTATASNLVLPAEVIKLAQYRLHEIDSSVAAPTTEVDTTRIPEKYFWNRTDPGAPQVAGVSPMVDGQTLDLQDQFRREDAAALQLAAILQRMPQGGGSAKLFEQFVQSRQKEAQTVSTNGVVNTFSSSGGVFGFEIGPRLKALENAASRHGRSGNVLDRQAFPALLIFGVDQDDLLPKVYRDGDNRLQVGECGFDLIQTVRWKPLVHKFFSFAWQDISNLKNWHSPRFSEDDRMDINIELTDAWNALQQAKNLEIQPTPAPKSHGNGKTMVATKNTDGQTTPDIPLFSDPDDTYAGVYRLLQERYTVMKYLLLGSHSDMALPTEITFPDPAPADPSKTAVTIDKITPGNIYVEVDGNGAVKSSGGVFTKDIYVIGSNLDQLSSVTVKPINMDDSFNINDFTLSAAFADTAAGATPKASFRDVSVSFTPKMGKKVPQYLVFNLEFTPAAKSSGTASATASGSGSTTSSPSSGTDSSSSSAGANGSGASKPIDSSPVVLLRKDPGSELKPILTNRIYKESNGETSEQVISGNPSAPDKDKDNASTLLLQQENRPGIPIPGQGSNVIIQGTVK